MGTTRLEAYTNDTELVRKTEKLAEKRGITESKLMIEALRKELQREEMEVEE